MLGEQCCGVFQGQQRPLLIVQWKSWWLSVGATWRSTSECRKLKVDCSSRRNSCRQWKTGCTETWSRSKVRVAERGVASGLPANWTGSRKFHRHPCGCPLLPSSLTVLPKMSSQPFKGKGTTIKQQSTNQQCPLSLRIHLHRGNKVVGSIPRSVGVVNILVLSGLLKFCPLVVETKVCRQFFR